MSGNIAIPVPEEEIESMEEAELLPLAEPEPEPEPLDTSSAVSIPDVTPLTDAVSSQELSSLRQEIDELRRDQQRLRQLLTDIASAIVGALPSDER
jgi:hypothetical protein